MRFLRNSVTLSILIPLLFSSLHPVAASIVLQPQAESKARTNSVSVSEGAEGFALEAALANNVTAAKSRSVQELTTNADTIVVGTVTDMTSYEEGRRGNIFTRVTLAVDETLKGTHSSQATVIVPGGEVNGLGLSVSHTAEFRRGEKVMVFLKEDARGFKVYGQEQGKFTIERDEVIETGKPVSALHADVIQAMGRQPMVGDSSYTWSSETLAAPPNAMVITPSVTADKSISGDSVSGWQDVFYDGFEGTFPGADWNVGPSSGYTDAYWGKTNNTAASGTYSVFCAAAGSANVSPGSNYLNNMYGWMITGPFDLSDATSANISFYDWRKLSVNDQIRISASINGSAYYALINSTNSTGWQYENIDVAAWNNIPGGPLLGKTTVWFAFIFKSDGSGTDLGVYIDEVKLRKYVPGANLPQITSISPSSAPAGTGAQVTITGTKFGSTQGESSLEFWRVGSTYVTANSTYGASIISWSDTQIVATVPSGASSGSSTAGARVNTTSGPGSDYPFTVTFSYGLRKWPGSNPMGEKYYVNPNTADTDGELTAVIQAMQTWNDVDSANFYFEYAGSTNATDAIYSGKNEIMWVNYDTDSIATNWNWYDPDTGEILESDIVFNDLDYTWDTSGSPSGSQMDVQTIAAHELGHTLTLLDLYGAADSAKTMYGYGDTGATNARTLEADDIAGIQWIYPGAGARGQYHVRVTNNDNDTITVWYKADTDPDYTQNFTIPSGQTLNSFWSVLPAGSHQVSIVWIEPDTGFAYGQTSSADITVEGDTEYNFTLGLPPLVTTSNATNISSISAQLNGALSSKGTATSANVSFQWGTASGNLTQETTPQVMGSTGNFSANLTGLTPGTTYYFRTKASGDGTAYGITANFTTLVSLPGSKIAFASGSYEQSEIYVIDPDGSNLKRLTNNGVRDIFPAISPDLRKVAFTSAFNSYNDADVYVVDVDGSSLTRLTTANGWDYLPAWSPDGSKIAYVSSQGVNALGIWVMNADGSNKVRLTPDAQPDTSAPDWSPDGTKIAFEHYVGSYGISVINSDGTGRHALTNADGAQYPPNSPEGDRYPAWSPDGSKIAFSSTRGGATQIWVMNADGANQTRVTVNVSDTPTWSPDGSQIAYSDWSSIFVMNADGTNAVRITDGFYPSWGGVGGPPPTTPPTVATIGADNVTFHSARVSGNVTSFGSASSANISFQWGIASGNLTQETPPQAMSSTGSFSANLTGLTPGTTYYFRAKAAGDGTAYGSELSFTTKSLTSLLVTPDGQLLLPGRTLQFTATGNYSDNTTQDLTAVVTWTSSNTDVAAISSTGLALAQIAGNTTITAALGGVTDNATLFVTTSVEVNSGQPIILTDNETRNNIPLTIKGIPDLLPDTGVGSFTLALTWNKDVIKMEDITTANITDFNITAGAIDNNTGTANITGNSTGSFLVGDNIIANLYIRAEGNVGDNTTISVTINSLLDQSSNNISAVSVNAPVGIVPLANVDISVTLQGGQRPNPSGWEIPLTVQFFTPGADVMNAAPIYSFTQNTTKSGSFAITQVTGITPGTYDITVKSQHTLLNVKRNVVISSSAAVNMGTLLEGNAKEDTPANAAIINIYDFGVLSGAWQKSIGEGGYNSQADFDRNGIINIYDFGLLSGNWQKSAPVTVP